MSPDSRLDVLCHLSFCFRDGHPMWRVNHSFCPLVLISRDSYPSTRPYYCQYKSLWTFEGHGVNCVSSYRLGPVDPQWPVPHVLVEDGSLPVGTSYSLWVFTPLSTHSLRNPIDSQYPELSHHIVLRRSDESVFPVVLFVLFLFVSCCPSQGRTVPLTEDGCTEDYTSSVGVILNVVVVHCRGLSLPPTPTSSTWKPLVYDGWPYGFSTGEL